MFNTKALEEEAIEVNRAYMRWVKLRKQHRDKALVLIQATDDPDEVKEIARILLLTVRKEEE